MPSLNSRNQVGKREDLSDVIAVVDARSCYVTSIIPKGAEPTNPLMTWQGDDYLEPSTKGVVEDKDRTEFENHSGRVPMSGRIQITERAPKVSRIAQNVSNVAGIGRKKEMAKAVAKAIVVAKRDIEVTILSANDSQEDDGVNPYQTRGLFKWIDNAEQGDLPVPEKFRTPASSIYSGTWAGLTEDVIRDEILGSIWDQSGMIGNYQAVVGRQLKALITRMTIYGEPAAGQTVIRTYQKEDDTVIHASVDRIEGDVGSMDLVASPWLRWDLDMKVAANKTKSQRSGAIFDPDMLEIRYNEQPNFRAFEDAGGGPRGLVEAIWGLVCFNPLGMGKIDPNN